MSMKKTPDSKMTRRFRYPDLRIMQMARKVHGSKRKGRNTSNLYFAKLLCAIAAAAGGCTTDATTVSPVEDVCGPAPTFPSFPAGVERLENGRLMVAITTEAYGALVAYRHDAEEWQDCALTGTVVDDPAFVRTVAKFDERGPAAEALLAQ